MIIAKNGDYVIINGSGFVLKVTQTIPPIQTLPVVLTIDPSAKNASTIRVGGNITNSGGSSIIYRGICCSTSQNPTILDISINNGYNAGSWTSELGSLTSDTSYYVKAWGINHTGIAYGSEKIIKTLPASGVLTILTTGATNVRYVNMTFTGNVTSDGGTLVFARGILVSTDPNPTELNSTNLTAGTGGGQFTVSFNTYDSSTLYYYKAYAENYIGRQYGGTFSITSPLKTFASVSTSLPTNITTNSLRLNGYMNDIGSNSVSSYGYLFGNHSGLDTINDIYGNLGPWNFNYQGSTGSFPNFQVSGLNDGSTYYYNTFTINEFGTSLGVEASIATLAITVPVMATDYVTGPTGSRQSYPTKWVWDISARILSNGNDPGGITRIGTIWSKYTGKVWEDINNIDTWGRFAVGVTTPFHNVTNYDLSTNTVYYVRSFGENVKGKGYSSDFAFNTGGPIGIWDISTLNPSDVDQYTGTFCMYKKYADGLGEFISESGYVWSNLNNNPTIGAANTYKIVSDSNFRITWLDIISGQNMSVNNTNYDTPPLAIDSSTYYQGYITKDGVTKYGGVKTQYMGSPTLVVNTNPTPLAIYTNGVTLEGSFTYATAEGVNVSNSPQFIISEQSDFATGQLKSATLYSSSTNAGLTTKTYRCTFGQTSEFNLAPNTQYWYKFNVKYGRRRYGATATFTTNAGPDVKIIAGPRAGADTVSPFNTSLISWDFLYDSANPNKDIHIDLQPDINVNSWRIVDNPFSSSSNYTLNQNYPVNGTYTSRIIVWDNRLVYHAESSTYFNTFTVSV